MAEKPLRLGSLVLFWFGLEPSFSNRWDFEREKNMSKQVRIGIVGTSGYADFMYYPRFKNHPGARMVAVCGRNRGRAEELAQQYAIPQVFTDYREMIQSAELDAVVAAVPDYLHYPVTMAALDAGLHVICEKPMAFNLAQAQEMLAKAEAAQVRHMVMFTHRWAPAFRTIARLVSQGYIGKCYDAHFSFIGGYAREGFYQWKWDRQYGLGSLGDLGAHIIDRARLIVGEIASVQASLTTSVPKPHPDGADYSPANDTMTLLLQFANGATGTISASAVAAQGNRGLEQRIILHGQDGTLEFVSNRNRITLQGLRGSATEFEDLPISAEFLAGAQPDASLGEQLETAFSNLSVGPRLFIDSILANQPIVPSFYDGVKTQEVIEAAFESARTGQRVAL